MPQLLCNMAQTNWTKVADTPISISCGKWHLVCSAPPSCWIGSSSLLFVHRLAVWPSLSPWPSLSRQANLGFLRCCRRLFLLLSLHLFCLHPRLGTEGWLLGPSPCLGYGSLSFSQFEITRASAGCNLENDVEERFLHLLARCFHIILKIASNGFPVLVETRASLQASVTIESFNLIVHCDSSSSRGLAMVRFVCMGLLSWYCAHEWKCFTISLLQWVAVSWHLWLKSSFFTLGADFIREMTDDMSLETMV